MNSVTSLASGSLSGWDFLIAGIIVLFVEYVIKAIFKDEKYKTVWKWSSVVLGVIVYVVLSFIQKQPWYTAAYHGAVVGLTAMGSYDIILKTMKSKGTAALTDTNKAIEEAINKKEAK